MLEDKKKIIKMDESKLREIKRKFKTIEDKYNISISFKDTEPFSLMPGKKAYVLGHSFDALYYGSDHNWYLESKSYTDMEIKGRKIINHRNIYRFIFTEDLPERIRNLIPKAALQVAKKGILSFDHIIELPHMSGIVIMIPAWNGTLLYYIKNPDIL